CARYKEAAGYYGSSSYAMNYW
nr:immunoglobulin heavy chain junction region [Mus musculus]